LPALNRDNVRYARRMRGLVLTIVAVTSVAVTCAQAQWTMQQSHTDASLRGLHNVGGGVVWASGTQGTVLHTTNDGQTWQTCAVPRGAEKLDFRGIQAFDADTAIVMSSGAGDLSRLYKTIDACRTWRLVFTNPDKEGFWDALQFVSPAFGMLIGDQVRGHFAAFFSTDAGETWKQFDPTVFAVADKTQSFFAASNTSLLVDATRDQLYMITGGGTTSLFAIDGYFTTMPKFSYTRLNLATGATAGGFSLASRMDGSKLIMMAVGGDFKAPERRTGTVVFFTGGKWQAPDTLPNGYRSAVAYYASGKKWITVGPNGTDISTDDGRNWSALKPAADEAPDANKNWNALSLPFVAGPNGRLGKLNPNAF
jgi:photosystem II stability/assembly factor-like uncharacterized protein